MCPKNWRSPSANLEVARSVVSLVLLGIYPYAPATKPASSPELQVLSSDSAGPIEPGGGTSSALGN